MAKFLFLYCHLFLLAITSNAQSWNITGNGATSPSTNFIGTTDNKAFVFKTNNKEQMRILATGQIAIGVKNPLQKLHVNGNINIDSGFALYMSNHQILSVEFSSGNTFLGNGIAVNSLGKYNTASGFQALSNTIGGYNTANGYHALYSNFGGSLNTASGALALYSNYSSYGNTANGYAALYNNNAGSYNTATGVDALYFNTAGDFNVADGNAALLDNSTGRYNSATGYAALYGNTTGSYNAAVGYLALDKNYDAENNVALGSLAGASPHGWNNTFIGSGTDATSEGIYNSTALGNNVLVSAPNQVRIGNDFVNSIGGFANWTNISDGRVKKNIKENVPGLAFINKLKPVTYNLDLDAADKILQRPVVKDKAGKLITQKPSPSETNARNEKQEIVYTGFIAQDVEKAANELNYDFSGVDAAKNDRSLYGLRYSEFVMPLVKAVQELSKMNDSKDAKINDLKTRLARLETMINVQQSTTNTKLQTTNLSSTSLDQNVPNPFSNTTTINYSLPQNYSSARIIVGDESGKTIKIFNVSGTGKGTINFSSSFRVGTCYPYSLYVDNKLVKTRQMVLVK